MSIIYGILIGFLNGFFGAGGGMLAVPLLKKQGLDEKKAHATSVAIILPLSAISAYLYSKSNNIGISSIFDYLPGGIVGAIVGAILLSKLSSKWIRKIFGILMLYSAWRLFFS